MAMGRGTRRRAAKDERAMSTNDFLARPGPALRTGGESLRRWALENELRAVAVGGYLLAVLVMLVLVISPIVGSHGVVPSRSPLATDAVPDYYTLRKDDTLAGIAARFGLTVEELRALNPGIDPMALAPGTKLRLSESAAPVEKTEAQAPPKPSAAAKKAEEAQTSPAAATAPQPAPPPATEAGGTHTVAPGDTLSSISARYGTTVDELLALNPGIDPYALVAGQEVAVP
jgi:LysM repeat protein